MRLCFYLPMALFPNVYEGKTYLMFHDQKLRSWELSLWLCFPKSIRYRSPQRVFLSDPILQGTFFFHAEKCSMMFILGLTWLQFPLLHLVIHVLYWVRKWSGRKIIEKSN